MAMKIFVNKGYYAANISDVADKPCISQGTIYHYFPSKEELFFAVFEKWETKTFYIALRNELDEQDSPTNQLKKCAHILGRLMNESSAFLPANVEFWSHIHRMTKIQEYFKQLFNEMRTILSQIIHNGIRKGEFTFVNPENTATIFIAVFDGLILQWLAEPNVFNWTDIADSMISIFLNGMIK